MSGVSLTALAAQIKKSNKDLVTSQSLTKEEKLELKRKRRAEIARRDQEKLENAAAIKLQSIFRGRHAKRVAALERERLKYILTQSIRFKKTKKHVAGYLRSVQRNYDKCYQLLLHEEQKEEHIKEAKKDNALNDEIWPILFDAERYGMESFNRELAITILRREGNDILNRPVSSDGRTLLHRCCCKSYSIAGEILLSFGADPSIYDNNGHQPLHVASYYGEKEMVVLLIAYGAKANSMEQQDQSTALHLACYENHLSTVDHLINIGGANVIAKDCHGITPLHAAAYRGNINIVQALLKQCNDECKNNRETKNSHFSKKGISIYEMTSIQSKRGVTPMMCCSYFRYREIMLLLASNMTAKSLSLKDEDGYAAR